MRILVVLPSKREGRFLVEIEKKAHVSRIKRLVGERKRSQAITFSLAKGMFHGQVRKEDAPDIAADLILSENVACWDLVK